MRRSMLGLRYAALAGALFIASAALGADEVDELIQGLRPSPVDHAVWAENLLKAAKGLAARPEARGRVYETAYEYGLKAPKGYPAAIQAARALLEAKPEEKLAWQQKLLDALRLDWRRAERERKREAGKAYIDQVITAADELAASGEASAAITLYMDASGIVRYYAPSRAGELAAKLKDARERQELQQEVAQCRRAVAENPKNLLAREKLIHLCVAELDAPDEAVAVLTAEVSEELRTYVPLASKDPNELADQACLDLANWYRQFAARDPRASTRCKRVVLTRAATYYGRALDLLKRDDLRRAAASAHLGRVMAELSALPGGTAYEPWRHQPLRPGILGRYFLKAGEEPLHTRIDGSIFFVWRGPPAPGVPAEGFEAEWCGVLNVPVSGTYQFHLQADDGGFVWIDDGAVAGTFQWDKPSVSQAIQLAKGRHLIRAIQWNRDGPARAELSWSKVSGFAKMPIPAAAFGHVGLRDAAGAKVNASYQGRTIGVRPGLEASIFEDTNLRVLAGKVLHRRVLHYWGQGGPKGLKDTEAFSVRWEGYLHVTEDDTYHFQFTADDRAALWLDDELVVPMGGFHPEGTARLSKGLHKLRIDYADTMGFARCVFCWRREGSAVTCPVPPWALFH